MKNNVKIKMSANKNNITFARGAVASFLVNCDLTINYLNEIKTIVSEAVTNAIVHGYLNDENKIIYKCYLGQKQTQARCDGSGL